MTWGYPCFRKPPYIGIHIPHSSTKPLQCWRSNHWNQNHMDDFVTLKGGVIHDIGGCIWGSEIYFDCMIATAFVGSMLDLIRGPSSLLDLSSFFLSYLLEQPIANPNMNFKNKLGSDWDNPPRIMTLLFHVCFFSPGLLYVVSNFTASVSSLWNLRKKDQPTPQHDDGPALGHMNSMPKVVKTTINHPPNHHR